MTRIFPDVLAYPHGVGPNSISYHAFTIESLLEVSGIFPEMVYSIFKDSTDHEFGQVFIYFLLAAFPQQTVATPP